MSIWFLCYSFSSTVFRRSELKQLGSLTSSKMKKKKQAVIEPLFHFFKVVRDFFTDFKVNNLAQTKKWDSINSFHIGTVVA